MDERPRISVCSHGARSILLLVVSCSSVGVVHNLEGGDTLHEFVVGGAHLDVQCRTRFPLSQSSERVVLEFCVLSTACSFFQAANDVILRLYCISFVV